MIYKSNCVKLKNQQNRVIKMSVFLVAYQVNNKIPDQEQPSDAKCNSGGLSTL